MDFGQPALIGVVFDISPNHFGSDSVRVIDALKNTLVHWVNDRPHPPRFYISHPAWQRVARDQGESTYFLISYQEPLPFHIDKAFRDAVGVVGNEPTESKKYVLLITDRFMAPNNYHYRQGFLMNDVRGYGCTICVIGIGTFYDKGTLAELAREYNASYFHLDNPQEIEAKLNETVGG